MRAGTGARRARALVLALVVAGCATPPPRPAPAAAAASQHAAAYGRVEARADLDGAPIGGLAAGQRATLLIVFASWCGHCRDELRELATLARTEPALRIVGVNAYEEWAEQSDDARLRTFLDESAPWLRVVRADPELLRALGGVPKIPSLFLYDREGRLVEVWRREARRPPDLEELEHAIAALRR